MALPTCQPSGDAALTAEGVDRAEALAANVMKNMIYTVAIAGLDTTITAHFLLADVLAALEFYEGVSAKEAVARMRHMTAERVARLGREHEAEVARLEDEARDAETADAGLPEAPAEPARPPGLSLVPEPVGTFTAADIIAMAPPDAPAEGTGTIERRERDMALDQAEATAKAKIAARRPRLAYSADDAPASS